MLGSLDDTTVFYTLDFQSGCWQVLLSEVAKSMTEFGMPLRLYKFNKIPFGLSNAPITFQHQMGMTFRGFIALIYLDDLIVLASSMSEYLPWFRLGF